MKKSILLAILLSASLCVSARTIDVLFSCGNHAISIEFDDSKSFNEIMETIAYLESVVC